MQQIIDGNLEQREEAAKTAEGIISDEVSTYRTYRETKHADRMLVRFREHHEALKQEALDKALGRLTRGEDPEAILSQLANQLTNKIIHTPSRQLKDAATGGEQDFLDAVTRLYQLDDDN